MQQTFTNDEILVAKILADMKLTNSYLRGDDIIEHLESIPFNKLPWPFENRNAKSFLQILVNYLHDPNFSDPDKVKQALPAITFEPNNVGLCKIRQIRNPRTKELITQQIWFELPMYDDMLKNQYAQFNKDINDFVTYFEKRFFRTIETLVVDADHSLQDAVGFLANQHQFLSGDVESILEMGTIMEIMRPIFDEAGMPPVDDGETTKISPYYVRKFWLTVQTGLAPTPLVDINIMGSQTAVMVMGALITYYKTLTN